MIQISIESVTAIDQAHIDMRSAPLTVPSRVNLVPWMQLWSDRPMMSDSVTPDAAPQTRVTVTVKLFAAYQDAYGVPELVLEFPPGATVTDVCDRLMSEHPELEPWRNLTRFGINLQFVEPEAVLSNGDEVVLIPPVSGG